METLLGESHAGDLKQESAAAKAERIIAEELQRLGWTQANLHLRLKGHPAKIALATRLKQQTIISMPYRPAPAHGHPQKRPQATTQMDGHQ